MYDDVTNTSKCEVATSLSQSCASGVAESYVSTDGCKVSDPEFQGEVTHQDEYDSHFFQS